MYYGTKLRLFKLAIVFPSYVRHIICLLVVLDAPLSTVLNLVAAVARQAVMLGRGEE